MNRARNGLLLVLVIGCLAIGAGGVGRAAESGVKIKDSYYSPVYKVIAVGDAVTWTNLGDIGHTVTTQAGAPESFDSSPKTNTVCDDGNPLTIEDCIAPGGTFSQTFTKEGTYFYYCKAHGAADVEPDPSIRDAQEQPCGMCATIVVKRVVPPTVRPRPTHTFKPSASPSPSPSVSASASPSPSDTPTASGHPVALATPSGGGGSGGGARAVVALLALLVLAGGGYAVWRRFLTA